MSSNNLLWIKLLLNVLQRIKSFPFFCQSSCELKNNLFWRQWQKEKQSFNFLKVMLLMKSWTLQFSIWDSLSAKSLQSCSTLCDPIDGSPPGSPVPGILQARTLEWVAISFSNAWMWKVKVKSLSRVWLFTTPGTAAYQALPSVGFSRQEYWSGMPLPSPGILYKTSKFYPVKIFVLFYTTFNAQFCVALRIMLRIQDLSSGWKFKVM